jgi:membrane-bound metal-dependent hydrolase YbcI (DUF457 family)
VIAGHFGLAAGAQASDHRAPLWSLMVATMWLDIVFAPLFVLGVETIDTPAGGGYGESVIHADYTHSLLGALVLSALFGLFGRWQWGSRAGVVLAAVAFSHWLLDLIVHRADLPLLPDNAGDLPLLGLGLWKAPVASITVEAALVVAGAYLYWRTATRYADTAGADTRVTPAVVSGVLLASGMLVLVLDALGI